MHTNDSRGGHAAQDGAPRRRSILATLTGYEILLRRSDDRNIDRLRSRLGCSPADARRVYGLAREQGFGAAYEAVFGTPPRQRPRPGISPKRLDLKPHGGFRTQRGHRPQAS